jgi:sugar phosphate isomerase/epimerase
MCDGGIVRVGAGMGKNNGPKNSEQNIELQKAEPQNTELQSTELIATCWTIAGDVYPGTERDISAFALGDRIEAAAAAGYAGIGLWHGDLLRHGENNYRELHVLLERNGLRQIELEHLADWFADGERRQRSDRMRADLFRAAGALGARHLKVVPPFGGQGWEQSRLIDQFGQLCAEAARHDLRVALEMIPFSDLSNLEQALAVVAGADAANGGLLIDIWHVVRSGGDFDDILRVPSRYIVAAELNDADAQPSGDLTTDSMCNRKPCGDGQFDVPAFIAALARAGYRGPYGVEILSDAFRRLAPAEAARISFDTTRAQFDAPIPSEPQPR